MMVERLAASATLGAARAERVADVSMLPMHGFCVACGQLLRDEQARASEASHLQAVASEQEREQYRQGQEQQRQERLRQLRQEQEQEQPRRRRRE